MRFHVNEPHATEMFWEGMREIAAAGARHGDDDVYRAIIKIGRAALAQGVIVVSNGGMFLCCPVCRSLPGQPCVNVPGQPLEDHPLHRQRVELAEKTMSGEAPIPDTLR